MNIIRTEWLIVWNYTMVGIVGSPNSSTGVSDIPTSIRMMCINNIGVGQNGFNARDANYDNVAPSNGYMEIRRLSKQKRKSPCGPFLKGSLNPLPVRLFFIVVLIDLCNQLRTVIRLSVLVADVDVDHLLRQDDAGGIYFEILELASESNEVNDRSI